MEISLRHDGKKRSSLVKNAKMYNFRRILRKSTRGSRIVGNNNYRLHCWSSSALALDTAPPTWSSRRWRACRVRARGRKRQRTPTRATRTRQRAKRTKRAAWRSRLGIGNSCTCRRVVFRTTDDACTSSSTTSAAATAVLWCGNDRCSSSPCRCTRRRLWCADASTGRCCSCELCEPSWDHVCHHACLWIASQQQQQQKNSSSNQKTKKKGKENIEKIFLHRRRINFSRLSFEKYCFYNIGIIRWKYEFILIQLFFSLSTRFLPKFNIYKFDYQRVYVCPKYKIFEYNCARKK